MIELFRDCPICECRQGELIYHTRYFGSQPGLISEDCNVVACTGCGFCFADTRAVQKDYDQYYAEQSKYADAATSTGAGISAQDSARLKVTAQQILQFEPDRKARLLDLGCATGGLLRELRSLGLENCLGMDPSAACVAAVRASGISGETGSLFALPNDLGEFDGIILSHVLEHVYDLKQALANLRGILKETGWLYIETPDASRYVDCLFAPFQDFNTEHINHFSQQSLRNLAQVNGFLPVAAGIKWIESAPGMPYPAVYAFVRPVQAEHAVTRDEALRSSLRDYVCKSQVLLDQIDLGLQPLVDSGTAIVVWGVGQLTLKLLAQTCLKDANITAFIDGNPVHQGKKLLERPVLAPGEFQRPSDTIVISSIINQASIQSAIARLGLPNPVFLLNSENHAGC